MNILTKAFGFWNSAQAINENIYSMAIAPTTNWYAEVTQNPIVYRCIKLIAQNVGSIPITINEDADPSIIEAIKQPNNVEDINQFIQKIVSYLLVDGDAYVIGRCDDDEFSMYTIDPKTINVNLNEFGQVVGYSYLTANGRRTEMIDRKGQCRILRIRNLNPFQLADSPCKVIAKSVQLYNSITKHNQAMMDNAARFGGALIVNGFMNDAQKQRIREEIDAKGGAKNAGHIAVLQGDMKWEEMKANVRDGDYTDGQAAVVRTICGIFGVPPNMLGFVDAGFNHYKEARLHFWEDTLLPLMKVIIGSLEKWLNHYSINQVELGLDLNEVPALADKAHKRMKLISELDFLSNDEKRKMCDL